MERANRAALSTFYAPGVWTDRVELSESAVHHALVKRLSVGDVVRLTSGDGRLATGSVAVLSKRAGLVVVDAVEHAIRPAFVELLAPVGDRDRMLMLAEKAVELGLSSWRPVSYERSRSVSSRGEGALFRDKVRARQVSALEQCGSAWLPDLHTEVALEAALASIPRGATFLLDQGGISLAGAVSAITAPVSVALGPEGGLTEVERAQFLEAGWRSVSLNENVLRFETAGIAALAILRSLLR